MFYSLTPWPIEQLWSVWVIMTVVIHDRIPHLEKWLFKNVLVRLTKSPTYHFNLGWNPTNQDRFQELNGFQPASGQRDKYKNRGFKSTSSPATIRPHSMHGLHNNHCFISVAQVLSLHTTFIDTTVVVQGSSTFESLLIKVTRIVHG